VKRRVARRTYHREKCTVNPAAVTCLTTSDGGRVAHESRRDVSPLAVKPPRLRPEFAESVKSRVTILARRAIDVLTDRPRTVFRPVGAARYFSQARAKLREYIVALVINLTAAADGVARVTVVARIRSYRVGPQAGSASSVPPRVGARVDGSGVARGGGKDLLLARRRCPSPPPGSACGCSCGSRRNSARTWRILRRRSSTTSTPHGSSTRSRSSSRLRLTRRSDSPRWT
jgi:hypothetical protein